MRKRVEGPVAMMLFSLYVQQNQWIVVALLWGAVLVILTCLTYRGMWGPRESEREEESKVKVRGPITFFSWVTTFMPWALILIILGSALYTVTHLYMAATTLPNW
ncbi:hypothetical protein LPW11_21180 [Geomonas sp. RF6]|uniref:hypothetical protein n=1 Tax=Geomonas sp. RF6 TaxID=2897342 RepID=UPI001E2D594F|nr:hypothetical protein [Geomonas sp. RF6]UFS70368.1 hypothetical protein LPW11_21180 [Geomonas sp. RF6]